MNRSQMQYVATTFDKEKRKDFKDRLSARVEASDKIQSIEPPKDCPILGKTLKHPSLGVGVVTLVNEQDNILYFKVDETVYDLIYSQVKSTLSPVVEVKKPKEDCFLYDEIDRTPLNRPDQVFLQRDDLPLYNDEVIIPEPLSEGDVIWHPSFGHSEILSIDDNNNTAILNVSGKQVEVVFSQIKSKVKKISGDTPDHVGFKEPSKEEIFSKTKSEYSSIEIHLPKIFKTLKPSNQYAYLKAELKLTPEQAGDVMAVFNGKLPLFNQITIQWNE